MSGKKAPQSKSSRAGLQFPVGRIHRLLRGNINSKDRVGVTAAVTPTLFFPFVWFFNSLCILPTGNCNPALTDFDIGGFFPWRDLH